MAIIILLSIIIMLVLVQGLRIVISTNKECLDICSNNYSNYSLNSTATSEIKNNTCYCYINDVLVHQQGIINETR